MCGLKLDVLKVASFHRFRPCLHLLSLINPFSFDSAGVSNSKPLDPKSGPRKAWRAARGLLSAGGRAALCFSILQPLLLSVQGTFGSACAVPRVRCH